MPVEEIPPTLLFTPIPLAARMTQGVPNIRKLILKQRQEVTKRAANASKGSAVRPPECRVNKFTNAGALKMAFTSDVKIPDGTSEKISQ